MKLICTVLNAFALFAVLLLGAVSAHAESVSHNHGQITAAFEMVGSTDHVDLQADSSSPSDPAMHCGAAILGLEALRVDGTFEVTKVNFYPEVLPVLNDSKSDNLRPPRA